MFLEDVNAEKKITKFALARWVVQSFGSYPVTIRGAPQMQYAQHHICESSLLKMFDFLSVRYLITYSIKEENVKNSIIVISANN